MKLTDRQVANLKPKLEPKRERYEVWEDKGFGVRVTPNGTKTFIFMYRFQGKPRRMTLGNYPAMTLAEAHKAHAEAREKLEKGTDPGHVIVNERIEDRKAPTVKMLIEEYLEKWAKPRKRSWKEDERILMKDIIPAWGDLKAKDITRRDVIRLLDDISDRGAPIQANRTLACVRKMLNFAVNRDILQTSPCVAIQAPAQENRRDRILTEDEILTFWQWLDTRARMAEGTKLALKLQLVTGQRKGEIVSARWDELDLNGKMWTIPPEKAKNGMAHRVPLSEMAIEILETLKELCGDSQWLFPSPRGDKSITPEAVDHALRRPGSDDLVITFVPHDLRRTAASLMTGMGISRLVVSKILNHMERGITAVYDRHSYDKEKRQALEAWGRRLKTIIDGIQEAKVIPMRRVS